jgi:Eco57I restriction-modification methylase
MHSFNQEHIKQFRFKELFNELGWDRPAQQQPFSIDVGDNTWLLDAVAVKKGVQVLHCKPDANGSMPDYTTRQKIERKVTNEVREHLIVFTDKAQTRQVWQWVARAQGKTAQYREVVFHKGETPELLAQKLSRLHFTLDEETLLTVLGVAQRLDDAAPRAKVTDKFYKEFEKQRKAFAEFIDGIPSTNEDQRWYTAVLIDRLMFLWFLQEKSFLDGKKDYLQSRLASHLAAKPIATFYKNFLCPLFFRGFAEERTTSNRTSIEAAFGKVPYLNGGLFAEHQLEQKYGEALDVEDSAFVKLFAFFDEWEWHLDERPLKSGKEINPDVLGYIFEKFVNQKQMGAYYTKEDITDYIGKNTIIPCLLAKVRAGHPAAFDALAWPLLAQSGDAYIYPAMLKGVDSAYPPEIANGLDVDAPDLLTRRKPWNKRANDAVSLPTEIWRETIARHERTREIRAKITAGNLREIGDFITYNLDIRQFAQDLIERCTDVALLKSFWFALAGRLPRKSNEKFRHGMSVLDPTCGSGAFLFAALNILKPLYDATLRTMHAVRVDALIGSENHAEKAHPERWGEVDEILERFAAAGSERAQDYAIIKHIIVNNLYGVDIEEQAAEIAKLRLFLKLVALLEPGDNIEPLPDIDFNIRHGNTLVGYATADETERAVRGTVGGQLAGQGMLLNDAWDEISIRLLAAGEEYNNFQIQQVQRGGHVAQADKQRLTNKLDELKETLKYHLAREYGVNTTKTKDYEKWKLGHQPFHWYVDFYPLMASGGFDVVIGNPPFIENRIVKKTYWLPNTQYQTEDSGNLYTLCMERCSHSLAKDYFAMIVPNGLAGLDDAKTIRNLLIEGFAEKWFSGYAIRPAKLFEGVDQRLCIFIGGRGGRQGLRVAGYRHWYGEERDTLLTVLRYQTTALHPRLERLPQISDLDGQAVIAQLENHSSQLVKSYYAKLNAHQIHYHRSPRYWIRAIDFEPHFKSPTKDRSTHHFRDLNLSTSEAASFICSAINSSLFFFWFVVLGNGRNITGRDVEDFPIGKFSRWGVEAAQLNATLMASYQENSFIRVRTDCEFQEFRQSLSKNSMDEIDKLLATHFDFTPVQLDYIINYDIKYRMGQGLEEDNQNEEGN